MCSKKRVISIFLIIAVMVTGFFVSQNNSFAATSSGFSISGATSPSTLQEGKGFGVAGVVKSNYKLNYVKVGAVDAKGVWVKNSYSGLNPNSYSYNLYNLDSKIKFGTLKPGTYRYKVWARDIKGKSKYLINKEFKVVGNVSSMKILGQTTPTNRYKGQSFSLKGKISSQKKLKSVKIGIISSSGKWISGNYTSTSPNSTAYDISNVDSKIKFGTLAAGTYYYGIYATDTSNVGKTLTKKKFTVSSFSSSGISKPSTLKKGASFSLKGTVTSKFSMSSMTVGVAGSSGKLISGKYSTVAPKTTSYSVAKFDSKIKFGTLANGTYYYKIAVKDSQGISKTILNQKFTVSSTSGGATVVDTSSGTKLSYISSVISGIGKQPYSGPCGIYAMAYARGILDKSFTKGKYSSIHSRIISEYGYGTSMAYWGNAGGSSVYYSTQSSCYKEVYRQIKAGRPCIISLYNNGTGNNHYVTVIGYAKGTTESTVSFSKLIILDPAYCTVRNMSSTNYISYTTPQLIKF